MSTTSNLNQQRWPISADALQETEAAMVAILAKPSTIGRRRQHAARLLTAIRKQIAQAQATTVGV